MILVDALLFDLDGTLVDSRRDLAISVQYLQKHYGVRLSSEKEVAAFVGDGVAKLVQRSLPGHPRDGLEEEIATFKKFYREHCLDYTRVYPGVRETLRHFRHKKIAVVTNKPVRVSGHMLEELGLSSFIAVLIGGDSLPNKKPHPEPVLTALKTLGVRDAKRAVMVGDGPNDVISGRAADTRTCGIKSNIGDPQKLTKTRPDFMIKNLRELMRIFA